jgi:hypothetical protein
MNDRTAAWSDGGMAAMDAGPHLDQVGGPVLASLMAEGS